MNAYHGSGKYWLRHIKCHGKDDIITVWHKKFISIHELVSTSIRLSTFFNIVASNNWANLKPETGLDGGSFIGYGGFSGRKHKPETIEKMRKSQLGHYVSDKAKLACSKNGRANITKYNYYRKKNGLYKTGADHTRSVSVTIDGITYNTLTEASRATGISWNHVRNIAHDPTYRHGVTKTTIWIDGVKYRIIFHAMTLLGLSRNKIKKLITVQKNQ